MWVFPRTKILCYCIALPLVYMESERDAPIYRIPTAAGAAGNVKSSVDQYVKFHNEKETEGGSRTEGYAEVC